MKFDQDFKDAVARIPNKEKDKLLLRLLNKDIVLANQLYFQLVQTRSVEELRTELEQEIVNELNGRSRHFYSPGVLMMYLREISGKINEHVSTTKDKYGDPYLNCMMLIHALQLHSGNLNLCSKNESYKFSVYVIARIFKIMTQVNTLHEDLKYDFNGIFEKLSNEMSQIPNLIDMAIYQGLNLNWLLDEGIPENILDIQKDLRKRGYLK